MNRETLLDRQTHVYWIQRGKKAKHTHTLRCKRRQRLNKRTQHQLLSQLGTHHSRRKRKAWGICVRRTDNPTTVRCERRVRQGTSELFGLDCVNRCFRVVLSQRRLLRQRLDLEVVVFQLRFRYRMPRRLVVGASGQAEKERDVTRG